MKETLTDIINKFILTSLVDIEEEYHDEVKSMMQLIGTPITHPLTYLLTHSLTYSRRFNQLYESIFQEKNKSL